MTINGREIRVAAIDFDGTLFTEDRFPEVGDPIQENIDYVKMLKENGVELILWTNREGKILEDAVEACKSVGIEFDAVNQNLQWRIDLYGNDCRKIGADIYIDDKAFPPDIIQHPIIKSIWVGSNGEPKLLWSRDDVIPDLIDKFDDPFYEEPKSLWRRFLESLLNLFD